jgi:NADH dehydrogenase FAD-containing subunit
MNATTTVVLGGGFGGIARANTLRGLLPSEHRIDAAILAQPHVVLTAIDAANSKQEREWLENWLRENL